MVKQLQLLIGIVVLLFGGAIYLIDRPPDQSYIFTLLPIWLSSYGALPRLPSAVGGGPCPRLYMPCRSQ